MMKLRKTIQKKRIDEWSPKWAVLPLPSAEPSLRGQ
jgi:hypothetical protein